MAGQGRHWNCRLDCSMTHIEDHRENTAVVALGPKAPRAPSTNLDPTGQVKWVVPERCTSPQPSHTTCGVERE